MSGRFEVGQGSLVVVHCHTPRERLWGVIVRLDALGLTLRGLALDTVEDWLRQTASGAEPLIGPSTVFVPMQRLERIYLDESSGAAEGLGDRFRQTTGRDAAEVLLGEA